MLQNWLQSFGGFRAAALLLGAMLLQQPTPTVQPSTPQEKAALDNFSKQAKKYIDLEHGLPADKLRPTTDVVALEGERKALRQALQQARPAAKQGDVFSPDAAKVFRKLLAETMNGPDGPKIRASLAHAEPLAPNAFAVNAAWPNTHGQPIQSVPPSLLLNLPVLPKGLEYSVAGRTLALHDTDANMVVDYLPDALP